MKVLFIAVCLWIVLMGCMETYYRKHPEGLLSHWPVAGGAK